VRDGKDSHVRGDVCGERLLHKKRRGEPAEIRGTLRMSSTRSLPGGCKKEKGGSVDGVLSPGGGSTRCGRNLF